MSVTPKRNLPPAAEPWGRSVDSRVQAIEQASARQRQDNDNTLSGLNSSLVRLSEQVGEIRTLTETLVEQQAMLQAQQQTLTSQQAQLTQTVTELETVVNGMITPRSRQSQVSGFVVTPSSSVIDTITFDVPLGYTRASVIAMSSVSAANPTASTTFLYTQIIIDSLVSGEGFDAFPGNQWASTYAQSARVISVTPGATLSISNATRSGSGTYTNAAHSARLVVQVLFLR